MKRIGADLLKRILEWGMRPSTCALERLTVTRLISFCVPQLMFSVKACGCGLHQTPHGAPPSCCAWCGGRSAQATIAVSHCSLPKNIMSLHTRVFELAGARSVGPATWVSCRVQHGTRNRPGTISHPMPAPLCICPSFSLSLSLSIALPLSGFCIRPWRVESMWRVL